MGGVLKLLPFLVRYVLNNVKLSLFDSEGVTLYPASANVLENPASGAQYALGASGLQVDVETEKNGEISYFFSFAKGVVSLTQVDKYTDDTCKEHVSTMLSVSGVQGVNQMAHVLTDLQGDPLEMLLGSLDIKHIAGKTVYPQSETFLASLFSEDYYMLPALIQGLRPILGQVSTFVTKEVPPADSQKDGLYTEVSSLTFANAASLYNVVRQGTAVRLMANFPMGGKIQAFNMETFFKDAYLANSYAKNISLIS